MRAVLVLALALASSSVSAQSGGSSRGGIGGIVASNAQTPSCLTGQVYDPNMRSCVTPNAGQDLTGYYIGGVLILGGVIGALVLANSGDKTVSP